MIYVNRVFAAEKKIKFKCFMQFFFPPPYSLYLGCGKKIVSHFCVLCSLSAPSVSTVLLCLWFSTIITAVSTRAVAEQSWTKKQKQCFDLSRPKIDRPPSTSLFQFCLQFSFVISTNWKVNHIRVNIFICQTSREKTEFFKNQFTVIIKFRSKKRSGAVI